MYLPERVSTRTREPCSTNSGAGGRDVDLGAGLERRGLGAAARGGVATQARLGRRWMISVFNEST